MAQMLPSRHFPPAASARREGLLAVGGRLDPDWLLDAYSHGIFPWPFRDQTLAWWSPDPRAVIEFDRLIVSRRLARTCRGQRFTVTCNQDFAGVVRGCATAQDRGEETWIVPEMRMAYQELHRLGYAHSIEVWHQGQLAGGTYGVAIGGLFAAESMFHYVTDASKVALVCLVRHLRSRGFQLLDIQQLTPHTASLGASEIRRSAYLTRLAAAIDLPVTFGTELSGNERV
ncbi:MAG: leucyl/phenylalanyl-tRNA--protein transferase [Pirellulales bacterium]